MTYKDNTSSCFANFQQYNNYSTHHNDVSIVYCQPLCYV